MQTPGSAAPGGKATPASGSHDPDKPSAGTEPHPSHGSDQHGSHLEAPPRNAESLDQLVTTTTTGAWIVVTGVLAAMVAALVWSMTAVLPQQTTDEAVVSSPGGGYYLTAVTAGEVEVLVEPGQQLQRGTAVAEIRPYNGGSPVRVIAQSAADVASVEVLNGSGVAQGQALVRLQRASDRGVESAVSFLPLDRISLYTSDSQITATFTDVASGESFAVPATLVAKSNAPASMDEIKAVMPSTGTSATLKTASQVPLYRLELRLDLAAVPLGRRTTSGQLLQLTNVYASPTPLQLLFGNTG